MEIFNEGTNENLTFYYDVMADSTPSENHNVLCIYVKNDSLVGEELMTHDEALAAIRDKTQRGFHVIVF